MYSSALYEYLQKNKELRDKCLIDIQAAIMHELNQSPPNKIAKYSFPENCSDIIVENVCNFIRSIGYDFSFDKFEFMQNSKKIYIIKWMED